MLPFDAVQLSDVVGGEDEAAAAREAVAAWEAVAAQEAAAELSVDHCNLLDVDADCEGLHVLSALMTSGEVYYRIRFACILKAYGFVAVAGQVKTATAKQVAIVNDLATWIMAA